MRLLPVVCLAILLGAAPAFAQRHGRSGFHPPTHCPERRMEGFCPYDSGWHPARDNPLFSPLRPGDAQSTIGGPSCDLTDSRDRTLLSFETEAPAPALRIAGRLVRFRPEGAPGEDRFVSAAGHLRIDEGAVIAAAHEFDARRATLTFTDRRGRAHVASVRINCGV
jgi:hypothetical protein